MYCKNCNISYEPTANFCTKCGGKLDILEPQPEEHTVDKATKFVPSATLVNASFGEMPIATKFIFIVAVLFVFILAAAFVFLVHYPELFYNFNF